MSSLVVSPLPDCWQLSTILLQRTNRCSSSSAAALGSDWMSAYGSCGLRSSELCA
jgi:hypothetical protein